MPRCFPLLRGAMVIRDNILCSISYIEYYGAKVSLFLKSFRLGRQISQHFFHDAQEIGM
jgi:hypothetical protein